MSNKPDCNRCDTKCNPTITNKRGERIPIKNSETCGQHIPVKGKWMLAELALEHPQSLHDALSSLTFNVKLDFYLR